jgi:polyvinyl alcohol dehydrogenase (cytochrome)
VALVLLEHPEMVAVGRRLVTTFTTLASLAMLLPASALANWTTYRGDGARSGVDGSTSSTPGTFASAWSSSTLAGQVYGQPLVYNGLVVVGTESDDVYALNEATGAVVWHQNVGTAVPAGQLPCGNITPTVGITSTPVIDPGTNRIFVVADTWDGSDPSSIAHKLFGFDVATGDPVRGLPLVVDGPGSIPANQLQRTALALDAGKVIVGYGGNEGDCGTYHGWLVAAPETGGAISSTFEVMPDFNQGAIWGSGDGPAVDSAGNLWVTTGNGDPFHFEDQESVLKLDSNLNLLDHWAPSNWSFLDQNDLDLGSGDPLLLPDGLVFEIGKQGVGYLLSASSLGGTGAAPLYSAQVCGLTSDASFGGAVYSSGIIYAACSDGVRALTLNATARTFSPVSGWQVNDQAIGPPIIAGGLVWSTGYYAPNTPLFGLDPQTGETKVAQTTSAMEHFTTPSASDGKLFLATGKSVEAYNIANPAVSRADTTTSISSESPDPSFVGQAVTVRYAVSASSSGAGAPTGNVTVSDGTNSCTGTVAAGQCSISFTTSGSKSLTASYGGDANFNSSSSSPATAHLVYSEDAVSVGTAPTGVAVGASEAYVANQGSNTVSVIDLTQSPPGVTATIPVGGMPDAVTLSADGSRLDVSNFKDGTVSVLDTATNTVTKTVAVGMRPTGIVEVGGLVHVANLGSSSISVFDPTQASPMVTSFPVPATGATQSAPSGLAASADGQTLYANDARNGKTYVFNLTQNPPQLTGSITNGAGTFPAYLSVAGTTGYSANPGSDSIEVLDLSGSTGTAVPVGSRPFGVVAVPPLNEVLATNSGADDLSVIDTSAAPTVTFTAATGKIPDAIEVGPNQQTVVVSNEGDNTVSIFHVNQTPASTGPVQTGTHNAITSAHNHTTLTLTNRNSSADRVAGAGALTVTPGVAKGTLGLAAVVHSPNSARSSSPVAGCGRRSVSTSGPRVGTGSASAPPARTRPGGVSIRRSRATSTTRPSPTATRTGKRSGTPWRWCGAPGP